MPKPWSKRSPFLEDIWPCKVDILYFIQPNGKCPVEDNFFNDSKQVSKAEKARLAAMIRRYALEGELKGEKRFRLSTITKVYINRGFRYGSFSHE